MLLNKAKFFIRRTNLSIRVRYYAGIARISPLNAMVYGHHHKLASRDHSPNRLRPPCLTIPITTSPTFSEQIIGRTIYRQTTRSFYVFTKSRLLICAEP